MQLVPPSAWGGVGLGFMYAMFHVVSPDHLGTLMSLSAVMAPREACKVGVLWGLGHSLGMATVGVLLVSLHHLSNVQMEAWEHNGDYVVGISMVLCALYFLARESHYIQESRPTGTSSRAIAWPPVAHRASR